MIMRWHRPGQKMAVGNPGYKRIIEASLCNCDEIVMEVMWGLKNLMHFLVPQEKMKLTKEDRLPMSKELSMVLSRHGYDVKPEMVDDRIIVLAYRLLDYELWCREHCKPFHWVALDLKRISGIRSEGWDSMKFAAAVKIICFPAERK
ncbi:hypothetical protein ACP4OV_004454 [Aristida adscensionis]